MRQQELTWPKTMREAREDYLLRLKRTALRLPKSFWRRALETCVLAASSCTRRRGTTLKRATDWVRQGSPFACQRLSPNSSVDAMVLCDSWVGATRPRSPCSRACNFRWVALPPPRESRESLAEIGA